MGDITFRTIVSFLHHNHRNEGVTMLKNIITPPELLYNINTSSFYACLFCKGKTTY